MMCTTLCLMFSCADKSLVTMAGNGYERSAWTRDAGHEPLRSPVLANDSVAQRGFERAPPHGDTLLIRRVMSMETYCAELVEHRSLTKDQRVARYGGMMPIPVPLASGETERRYEERFVEWLANRSVHLSSLSHDTQRERSYRISFASIRANQAMHPESHYRPVDRSGSTEVKRKRIELSERKESNGETDWRTVASGTEQQRTLRPESTPNRCSFRLPAEPCSFEVVTAARIACGCQQCSVQCLSRIQSELINMKNTLRASELNEMPTRSDLLVPTRRVAMHTNEASIKQDPEVSGPELKRIRRLTPLEVRQLPSAPSSRVTSALARSDPIEKQLMDEYNELNERVLMNKRALERSKERLQVTTIDQICDATAQQDEIEHLRGLIRHEMDSRNAAVAVVIVYLWRKDVVALQEMLRAKGISKIPQVAGDCHRKCAQIATQITTNRKTYEELTQRLNARLAREIALYNDAERDTVRALGEGLARIEQTVDELVMKRRQTFMLLIQFDEHIRQLLRALLADS